MYILPQSTNKTLNYWFHFIHSFHCKDALPIYIHDTNETEITWKFKAFWNTNTWCKSVSIIPSHANYGVSIVPSHKSHNASDQYPTIHHFVTEICISVHISVTKWCIVGYWSDALWDLWDVSTVMAVFIFHALDMDHLMRDCRKSKANMPELLVLH